MKNIGIAKKIKKIAVAVILSAAGIVVALTLIAAIVSRVQNKPAFIFGYSLMWVRTGSMEPAIEEKSFILVKDYNGQNLADGDVITYVCDDKNSRVYGALITHRIIGSFEGGYITQGDASAGTENVKKENVIAFYVKNLPVLTFFGRLYASPAGLIALISLFVCSCAFVYVPDIVSAFKGDATESEKQKIIDERVKEGVEKLKAQSEKPAYKPVNGTFAADNDQKNEKDKKDLP